MLLSDLVSSKIRRSIDGSEADAICFTVNLRRSDVCNEAILECYCTILFLLKYDGLVIVRKPMQFLQLSIYVGQMFVQQQFWNVLCDLISSKIRRSSDSLPTWLIKRLIPDLAETIAKMCILSLSKGIIPDCLKNAIVRPRLKKINLDPEDMNSYRPISNLTFLSKTVERAVAIRFVEHSELDKLMPCHQSANRSFHSKERAVLAVHNDIVQTIDSGKISALVLLDLNAAFDTVDHPVLLQFLQYRFCVRDGALGWIGSYLSNRTQTYQVKDQQSSPRLVDCRVPQGSVLGPQGFIAYTEDLAELIESTSWVITCMPTTRSWWHTWRSTIFQVLLQGYRTAPKPSRSGGIREGSSWIQQRLSWSGSDQKRIWRKSPISISISTSR